MTEDQLALIVEERDAWKERTLAIVEWADELRDRIRDISLGHEPRDIERAEVECRIRHESICRPSQSSWPVSRL
jgi:tRNA A37 threonylcarbamoyladenosine biosynthesis protein TsaE